MDSFGTVFVCAVSKRNLLWLGVLLWLAGEISASGSNSERRCFSFTWLGPSFNNQSVFMNATCQDATRLSAGVPCVQPLVVSKDGTWPDVEQIWTEYKQPASCVLNDNDVCAQFTYYFNGRPENSTYMCTRAVNTLGAAITSGCYQQVVGSASTKVCFCRSLAGGVPCNRAAALLPHLTAITAIFLLNNLYQFVAQ